MTDTKQTSAIADATAAPRSGRLPAAQDSGPSDTPVRNGHLIGYARVSTRAQGPSVITPELLAAATAMRDKRELTMAQIARTLKIGRSTLYKHLDINHETNTEHDLAA